LGICLLITGGLYFFKDEICGYVIEGVNKHLKAQVSVSEVDLTFWGSFPNLSVDFNDVFIRDSYKKATVRDTLLYSERIRLKFNPVDIWNENYNVKSIEVEPGTIQLKVKKNGEVNYDILKSTEDTTTTKFELKLEDVSIQDVRFSYINRATNQTYRTGIHSMDLEGDFTEKQFTLHAKSDLKVDKAQSGHVTLISNRPVKFDLGINIDKEKDRFEIRDALVYLSNLPFKVNGTVDPYLMDFEVHSQNIELTDLANNLSVAQADDIKKFDGTGNIFLDLFIKGKNDRTSPTEMKCDFGIKNGSLTEPIKRLKINNIQLAGKYSNEGGPDKEFLRLSNIRFSTPGGPFSGELLLTHFDRPNFEGNANGNISLNMLHALFHLPYVENVYGNLGLRTEFEVQSFVRPDESMDYSIRKCEGEVDLKNVNLKLLDDKRTFRSVNGALYLRNDEAGIDHVSLKVGASDLAFDGVFKNIVKYFQHEGNLNADVEIKGAFIDVQDLGTTSKEEKIQDGREFVIPNDIEGSVLMEVGEIKYEEHRFRKLIGKMLIDNRKLEFPGVSLRNAGADVQGSLIIEERSPEIFHITTQVQSDNLQFKPLFREWNNFHQDVIGENNIFGKAQAKVYFEAPFDLRSGVISKSIRSQVYLKVTDGRLKNVDAFRSITESLKTNSARMVIGKDNIAGLEKKLLDLRFETLENTFTIENSQLVIPAMLIHTNALDIETSGTHTFDNRIDYRFVFRFRDLKDKSQMTEFGEEVDDGTGMKVFMRMHGTIDDPVVEWDKTSRKEQAKENREAEKETVKSILKTEFGMFKGDSTVKTYQEKEGPKETLKIEFGPAKTEEPIDQQKKTKKDSKIKNTLKNWKEESDKSKQEEIDIN
jgi:hypothetical protein